MSIVEPVEPSRKPLKRFFTGLDGAKTTQAAEKTSPPGGDSPPKGRSCCRIVLVFLSTFLWFSLAEEKDTTPKTAEDHEGALKAVVSITGKITFPLKVVAYLVMLAIALQAGHEYSKTTIINRSTKASTCCAKTCSETNDHLITTTFKSSTNIGTFPHVDKTTVTGFTIGDCGNGDQTLWNGEKLTFDRTEYPDLSFLVEDTEYATTTWFDMGYLSAMYEVGTTKICDNAAAFQHKYGPTAADADGYGERKEQCIYGFEASWHPDVLEDPVDQYFTVLQAYGIFNHTTLKDVFLTRCESIEAEDERSVLLMKEALENSIFKNDMQLRVSAMAIDAYLTSARFRSVTSYNSFQNNHDNMISTFKLVLTNHLDTSVARVASVWRDVASADPLEDYASDLILGSAVEWYDQMTEDIMFKDLASDEEDCIELCNHFEPVDCSYYSEPTPLQVFFYALTIMGAFGWVYGFWAVALPHKIISQLYKINTIFKTTDGRLHGGKKIF